MITITVRSHTRLQLVYGERRYIRRTVSHVFVVRTCNNTLRYNARNKKKNTALGM